MPKQLYVCTECRKDKDEPTDTPCVLDVNLPIDDTYCPARCPIPKAETKARWILKTQLMEGLEIGFYFTITKDTTDLYGPFPGVMSLQNFYAGFAQRHDIDDFDLPEVWFVGSNGFGTRSLELLPWELRQTQYVRGEVE